MKDNLTEDFIKLVQMDLKRFARDGKTVTIETIEASVEKAASWDEAFSTIPKKDIVQLMSDRFAIWIGEAKALDGDDEHTPWLTPERKQGWRYWSDYEDFLSPKIAEASIESLDRQTDEILKRLEDPHKAGPWDRRGLVVGHVQSGKTSNYTGLISKAADAGYKIIIVLAGLHNNLRSQTQMRLDEGFLGYETSPNLNAPKREIGVGIGREVGLRPNYVTNRSDSGDFRTQVAKHLGIRPEQTPWLFVVKKNKTVLTRLLEWIRLHVAEQTDPETGRRVVTKLPLLLIDDEADNASVDTAEQEFDGEGNPDPEHDPTVINSLIRQILGAFHCSAYVGYTATPFANIFIHEKGRTKLEGEDLFPRSFIINLPAPSNYVGPMKVFGHVSPDGSTVEGLPLLRDISDFTDDGDPESTVGWMPNRHKNGYLPLYKGQPELPPSLREAIQAFVLTCAIRRARGQGKEHCSMLIHVTRFTSVQGEVTRQVKSCVEEMFRRLRRGIGQEGLVAEFRTLLEHDFIPTTRLVNQRMPPGERVAEPDWNTVEPELIPVLEELQNQTRAVNGTAKDVLDYADNEVTGIRVVAVGGDKLARGLTLEGLTVSYFLRASRMYDTLMQMGRWFGYRPGYTDLSRLYTTDELQGWFRHITNASEELRQAFDHMSATQAKPREYGLRVKSHEVMTVTSRTKMRSGRELRMSYAGEGIETTVLFRDRTVIHSNADAVEGLLAGIGEPNLNHSQPRPGGRSASWDNSMVWTDVSGETIATFLSTYRTHETAYKANSIVLAKYVEEMLNVGELTEWVVAVLHGDSKSIRNVAGKPIHLVERTPDNRDKTQIERGRYVIRRLLSPRDEAIDLDLAAFTAALDLTNKAKPNDPARGSTSKDKDVTDPSGPAIRTIRGRGTDDGTVPAKPTRGVLLIYPLDPQKAEIEDIDVPVFAIGISFPYSSNAISIPYVVNNAYWEQELGGGMR
jgi:hypothetical protein